MDIITKEELLQNKDNFFTRIEQGVAFIYPTDTIYGLGCNAADERAVAKLRKAKHRYEIPFSVIAPSKKWILENCEVAQKERKWINKLPGPYTLILTLKNKDKIADNVTNGLATIGLRIPDNWFSNFINELGFPIVTTSANIAGQNFMTSLEDLDIRIKAKADFIIYEGEKHGRPSQIVNLVDGEKIISR